jgi:hypothetical protein
MLHSAVPWYNIYPTWQFHIDDRRSVLCFVYIASYSYICGIWRCSTTTVTTQCIIIYVRTGAAAHPDRCCRCWWCAGGTTVLLSSTGRHRPAGPRTSNCRLVVATVGVLFLRRLHAERCAYIPRQAAARHASTSDRRESPVPSGGLFEHVSGVFSIAYVPNKVPHASCIQIPRWPYARGCDIAGGFQAETAQRERTTVHTARAAGAFA